jgi:1-acyl-sn-glycerol-3-phosphate acyltransferase
MVNTAADAPANRATLVATAVALVRSIVAYVIISLYVLLVGPLAILLTLLVGSSECLFVPGIVAARMALALVGIRYRVAGRDRLPPRGVGVVFAANHQSNVDPPVLFLTLHPRLRMLYKVEFDRIPILSHAMRLGRFVAIDRRDRTAATEALERAAGYIDAGLAFLIFPEGTRSRTGELLPFKKGVFIMALLAHAPIVPVAITGARDAMRKGSPIVRPVTVSVRVGAAVETRGLTIADRDELMAEVRRRIEDLIREGPVGAAGDRF